MLFPKKAFFSVEKKPWETSASRKTALFALFVLLFPVVFALDAPVVTSATHPVDVWAKMPMLFEWNEVAGATQYCYALTSSPDAPELSAMTCISGTSVSPPQKRDSGDYYFHVNAGDAESASAAYHIKLDVDKPSSSILSAKSLNDGNIELSWTAAEDSASGVKEYVIYRKLVGGVSPRDTPVHARVPGSATSFVDANQLEQSTTYHYIVLAADNAGITGGISNEAYVKTAAKCDLDITFSKSLSGKSLALGISNDTLIYHGGLSAVLPDGSEKVFFADADPFDSWDGSLDLSGVKEGYIDFSLAAKEFFGDDCGFEARFVYDVTAPGVRFVSPKYNDRVSEVVPLKVEAEDSGSFKSGLEPPVFFLKAGSNWEKLGDGIAGDGGVYSFDWDSFSVENGQQELKVVLTDLGGNKSEVTVAVVVLNAFGSVLDTNAAMEQAMEAREKALQVLWGLEGEAIVSEGESSLIDEAEGKLNEAVGLSKQPDLESQTNAKALLAEAILLFQKSQKVVSTSVYKTAEFVFNKEQAGILLNAAGISGPAVQQAVEMIGKADPKRQLQILKVVDNNNEYYRAIIVVSFSLDVNILADSNAGDRVLQVIEVVPKEFAEYAAELDSNIAFDVLYDDPKLSFVLTRDEYRKKSFSYAFKDNLSQLQADTLISGNVVNKFVAPPILLPVGTVTTGLAISSDFMLYAIVAIVIIIAALVILILLKKRRSSGKDYPKPKRLGFGAKESGPESKGKKQKPVFWKVNKKPFSFTGKSPGESAPNGAKPFSGVKLPKLGGKKNESPLSVFGKK